MQPCLDLKRRKERMTNYFTSQQQQDFRSSDNPLKVINPNRAPQSTETPLIEQVKFYFSSRVNTLEFAQIFEGKESITQMRSTVIYTSMLLLLILIPPLFFNYVGKTFCIIILLLNGFHILGKHMFYFSKNPNNTLIYLTAIMFFEFCLFHQLWGGGLQNNLFSIMYVLYNGLRFVQQLPMQPPTSQEKLKTFNEFFFRALMKSIEGSKIFARLTNFFIFLIPTQSLLLLINYIYPENNFAMRKLMIACLIDLVFQFSDSILIICKKYTIFCLSNKLDQLPLFVYPLGLQNNPQQEIASINFINSLNNDDKIFDQKLMFRLDGHHPPIISDIIQSYYYEKLKNYVADVQEKYQYLKKLTNERNKVRNLFEDITLPYTIIKTLYLDYRTRKQLKQVLKFYYFIFKSFDKFQKDNLYEQDCIRFNVRIFLILVLIAINYPKRINYSGINKSELH